MTPNPPDGPLRSGDLRPFLGPRSSSFERLKQVCIFGRHPEGLQRRGQTPCLGWWLRPSN
eukprot:8324000-Alexandrium_andersonii.AAC.1